MVFNSCSPQLYFCKEWLYILHRNVLHCYVGNYNAFSLQSSDACASKGLLHTEPVTSHYITLHCTTLHRTHHITIHYITLHSIPLHYIASHHITLHYITLYQNDWLTLSLSPATLTSNFSLKLMITLSGFLSWNVSFNFIYNLFNLGFIR